MSGRRDDRYDVNIFADDETFSYFLLESTRQFSQMKYGNKDAVIATIRNDLDVNVRDSATYTDLIKNLPEHSKDFFTDVLHKESKEDVAHCYVFYKFLNDIFWETSWISQFSPFYEVLTGDVPDIANKSEKRQYAETVVLNYDEEALIDAWREFATKFPRFSAVAHYDHLTIGPLGLAFSRYPRQKDMISLGSPSPVLDLITAMGDDGLFDRVSTDFVQVFATLLNELKGELETLQSENHLYWRYWDTVGLDEAVPLIDGFRQNISALATEFEDNVAENEIILFYWILSQLSTMVFRDEKIIDILNRLIAQDALVVTREEDLDRNLKITTHGFIVRPNTWRNQAVFELAEDIATVRTDDPGYEEELFSDTLRTLVRTGPIDFLDDLRRSELDLFKELMRNKNIYAFDDKERYEIPSDTATRILLETYGVTLPAETRSAHIEDLTTFLSELEEFQSAYRNMDEDTFIQQTIRFLQNGRTHLERYLKEFFFLLSALILFYIENHEDGDEETVFPSNEPVFSIGTYNQEQEIQQFDEKYKSFLGDLGDHVGDSTEQRIDQFVEGGTIDFTLNDWYQLVKGSLTYLRNSDVTQDEFWSALPDEFATETQRSLDQIDAVLYDNGFSLLNMASHEEGRRNIRTSGEVRNQAATFLVDLRDQLERFYRCLPDVVWITEEREELETGVTSYAVKYDTLDGTGSRTIYGSRVPNTTFTYFAIPLISEDEDLIYPILVTNLVDVIF